MDALVEPPACVGAFTTTANRLHCIWRGAGPAKGTTKIKIFNPTNDEWTLQPTTGTPPRGLWNGGCAFIGKDLYSFGGNDGSFSHFNYLHKLSLETFQWSEIHPRNDQTNWPMPKSGCGFTAADERTLCCFGGVTNIGRTNEFHLFDVQEGVWSSPLLRGEIPPAGSDFSFTKIDQNRVIQFGGYQSDRGCVDDLYLFNMKNMEVTKVEPLPGVPQPVRRAWHSACCVNYGENHPKVLISGGVDKDSSVLGDMWILDANRGKWKEMTPPESVKKRWRHSITASRLGPGLTKVLVFGGSHVFPESTAIAEAATLDLGLRILTQPENVTCNPGDNLRFSIKTSKTAHAYQWYLDGNKISTIDKDYEGSTTDCLSINECLPKHKGSYKCVVTTELDIPLTTEIATLKIDGDQLEEAEAKLLGEILKASNIAFSDTGVNIQQLLNGESALTYEEMQFVMKDNPTTRILSMNLKQELRTRVREDKLYEEAIQNDKQVSLYYIKLLALGPAQVGKSTFIHRLLGFMQWDIDSAPMNTQPQCSTGQCELKEAFIEYKSDTLAISTCGETWHAFEEESQIEKELMVFTSLLNEQTKIKQSKLHEPINPNLEGSSLSHIAASDTEHITEKSINQDADKVDNSLSGQFGDSVGTPHVPTEPMLSEKSIRTAVTSRSTETADINEFYELRHSTKVYENKLNSVKIIVNVADIGGQPAFLEMLPSLTIGPAMYLVFMKALQGLQTEYTTKFKSHNDMQARVCENYAYTAEEVIFTALSSIACLGHTDQEIEKFIRTSPECGKTSSLALLMATFTDEIDPHNSDILSETDQQLKKMLQETCFYTDGLIEYSKPLKGKVLHNINNKSGGKAEVDEFREKIRSLIEKRFHKYKIPARWLSLSMSLRLFAMQNHISVLPLSLCLNIGSKCFKMREEMVRVALKFLHRYIGLVLYFPENDNLKDYVICNPQAVFSAVNELIFNVYDPDRRSMTSSECERFVLTGRFCPARIKVEREDIIPMDYLTHLLVHLNIAAPVKSTIASPEYFLPAVLQTAKKEELKINLKGENEEQDPEPLCVLFRTGYLPLGFVCALASNLINKNTTSLNLLWEQQNQVIYKNKLTFRFRGRYDIVLISWPKYCEFRVSRAHGAPCSEGFHYSDCCPLIKDMLTKSITLVLDGMRQRYLFQQSEGYNLAFKCSNHSSNQDPGHEALAIISSDFPKEKKCTTCMTTTLLTPHMSVWLGEPIPLRICEQPPQRVHIEQESTRLSILASGCKPLAYQWLKNSWILGDNESYAGTKAKTLLIRGRDPHLKGYYCCEVKDRCGKTILSSESELTVGKRAVPLCTDNSDGPESKKPRIEEINKASLYPPTCTHIERDQPQLVELCRRFNFSYGDINKEVSDDHILKIYPQLENWKRIAAHLGLTQADVQAIENGARPDEELMRLYMFQEWKRKKTLDRTATYQVLLKALIECKCSKSAIQVCELLKTCTTPHH